MNNDDALRADLERHARNITWLLRCLIEHGMTREEALTTVLAWQTAAIQRMPSHPPQAA